MNGSLLAHGPMRRALGFLNALVVAFALPVAAPADARPVREADGLWVGTVELAGARRSVAIALAERTDGRLLGYLVGGTGQRTVVTGRRIDRNVTITIETRTPAGARLVTIEGRLAGRAIRGTASEGAATAKIVLLSIAGVVNERRFVVAPPAAGDPVLLAEIAVALDGPGAIVAGGWIGLSGCEAWGGCDGEVTSISESPSLLTIGFRNDDPCSVGSTLTVTLDAATKIYSGSYRLNTCRGPVVAPLLAARTTRTRSDHVGQVLGALGTLGDDLEAGVPLAPPHPSFSPGYADSRIDLAGLLAKYNAEMRAYRGIEATFRRVSLVTTVPEPVTPFDVAPLGALFDEQRSGIPSGSSTRVVYFDNTAGWVPPRLRVWAEEAGRWVVRGDGVPPLDFPFAYTVGTNALEVPYGDGSTGGTIHVSLGAYGTHFAPSTGHANGDAKANLAGFFSASDAELTTLSSGERAYWGGIGGSLLLARRPLYIAPEDATMSALRCTPAFTGGLGGEVFQWEIELRLANGESLRLGHLGRLAASLAARLASLGLPASCAVPDGTTNLLGGTTLPVARGESLAYPQVAARQVAPGYFVGGGTFADRPWAPMEFFLTVFAGERGEVGGEACYYDYLPTAVRAPMQRALDTDMADPMSQRWRNPLHPRWRWAAEGRLCMAPWVHPRDFSDLYTNLGGWFEKDEGSIVSDEIVAFAPIAMDVASYDPANYGPGVTMLIVRQRARPGTFWWSLPGIPPAGPIVVRPNLAAGEILERTADSLLIRWRGLALPTDPRDTYQRAAYNLDPTMGLKIHWGNLAATAADAILPTLTPAVACNGETILCYDHTYHAGY